MTSFVNTATRWVLGLILLASGGCSWMDAGGTRHALILGIGLVSTKDVEGVSVRDSRGVGILVEPGSISGGLVQRHVVSIDPKVAPDVILSVSASPLSLKVESFNPSAACNARAVARIRTQRPEGGDK